MTEAPVGLRRDTEPPGATPFPSNVLFCGKCSPCSCGVWPYSVTGGISYSAVSGVSFTAAMLIVQTCELCCPRELCPPSMAPGTHLS